MFAGPIKVHLDHAQPSCKRGAVALQAFLF